MQPLGAKPPLRGSLIKSADNKENKEDTKTLIQHVKTALHNYQSFERGVKPLENKIAAIPEKKKELVSVYGKAVQKLLTSSLEVSEADFAVIKKFSRELHNSTFNHLLHEIEASRKTQSCHAMQDFVSVLDEIEQSNLSKEGLPWEQYALGSSPQYTLSEKKALLNLLSQFHDRLEKSSNLSADAKRTLASLRDKLEEKTESLRMKEAPKHLQIVTDATSIKEIKEGWTLERSKEIYDLINTNIDALYGSYKAFKVINPLLYQMVEKLKDYPSKIRIDERVRLTPLLQAAEKEQYLKSYLAEYPHHKKKAEELHLFINQQISAYQTLPKQGNSVSLALEKLRNMNAAIPTQQPDWKQILSERGFTLRKIGEGGMGEVFMIRRKKTDGTSETYVVKTFKENKPTYLDWLRAATGEKTARVQHKNLIQTIGGFVDETGVHAIVMPYFEKGSELLSYIEPSKDKSFRSKLSFAAATELADQLIEAVKALHDENILHHDIKDSNIMVRKEKDDTWKLVLVDAGFQEKLSSWKPKSTHAWGTRVYMPPEKLYARVQGKGVDVYSLGVVIYRMYVNQFPYKFKDKIPFIDYDARPDLEALDSEPLLQHLLEAMLDPNPDTRYTIDAVKYAFHNFRRTRKV